jgi:hypothetical protein
MRFVDPGGSLRFTPEALLERGVVCQMGWQNFERDDAVGSGVVGR